MNHSNFSPGQPNEALGRKVTPSAHSHMEDGDINSSVPGSKKQSVGSRFLLSEDLQKIKHSSHRNVARRESQEGDDDINDDTTEAGDDDIMDDSDHDNNIQDLLYPALEDSSSHNMDFDFFEEDYNAAQAAMNSSVASTTPSAAAASFRSSTTSMQEDSFRNASISSTNSSFRGLMNDSSGASFSNVSANANANANNASSQSSYLNYLRRRGSTNTTHYGDAVDQTTRKHRR